MREIKSRGQRSDDKEWVYGFLTKCQNRIWENGQSSQDGYKLQIISHEMPIGVWDILPETVGQFTGLKDKNGVDIYEGDIIKHGESIRFIEYRWSNFTATRPCKTETILLSFCSYPEVIGNIHTNPELLNNKI